METVRYVEMYTTSTCQACKKMQEYLTDDLDVRIIELNDDNKDLFAEFGIKSAPTLFFYKDGEMVLRTEGYLPEGKFMELYLN
jgi:thioredoxin-related protein